MKTHLKTIALILLVLPLIGATIKLFSMEYFKTYEMIFSIMRDVTENRASHLNAEQVIEQLDLNQRGAKKLS